MVANSAGGYSFPVDKWSRLDRFLILGADAPTYYISEQQLVKENAQAVIECIKEDGVRTVKHIVEISDAGRAPKNDPAMFALVLAISEGNQTTKDAAYAAFSKVVRIGTHLFQINDMHKAFGGWGRGWRKANANWYAEKDAQKLAYQLIKYQQRGGWSHGDILRLAHPKVDGDLNLALSWAVDKLVYEDGKWFTTKMVGTKEKKDIKWVKASEVKLPDNLRMLEGFQRAKTATDEKEIISIISDYKLPWEAIPTDHLKSASVWEALLPDLPMTAMLRNLGRMSANGLLTSGSQASKIVAEKFSNADVIKKSRIHPFNVLIGMKTYESGHGVRGSLTWSPVRKVVDAIDGLFYASFGNVEPSGKNVMLALDVSGSMCSPISETPVVSCREASAAMAMVTARSEQNYIITGFCDHLVELDISPRQRLDDVVKCIDNLPFGGTDCALPMMWAMGKGAQSDRTMRSAFGYNDGGRRKVKVAKPPTFKIDAFVIYTDSETWAGTPHPVQALEQYRREMQVAAKMIVVGMASSSFSIADPNDGGMLDIVGFDTSAPQVIADFIKQ
jgi:60 kDa SS-A/Ro ribonucleoprotein